MRDPCLYEKVLKSDSLPPPGASAHCTPRGVRTWRPAFDSLDVQHLPSGAVMLTMSLAQLGAQPVLFELSACARNHLVTLLLATDGAPAVPAEHTQEAA